MMRQRGGAHLTQIRPSQESQTWQITAWAIMSPNEEFQSQEGVIKVPNCTRCKVPLTHFPELAGLCQLSLWELRVLTGFKRNQGEHERSQQVKKERWFFLVYTSRGFHRSSLSCTTQGHKPKCWLKAKGGSERLSDQAPQSIPELTQVSPLATGKS